jgi:2-haloalkanoic acid dehalogenase type II
VVQAERFRSYREVLRETALRMAQRFDWELTPTRAEFLPESLARWRPFTDTNPALKRLTDAGCRLAILSNVDDDLLAATLRQLHVPFELRITAEQIGSYKPAHGHFLVARKAIGSAVWLHAAQSWFHDVAPACALGVPAVWVNRNNDEPAGQAKPVRIVRNLKQLADWLVG